MTSLLGGGIMKTRFGPPNAPGSTDAAELPVGPNVFETMRMPLLAGRPFVTTDFGADTKPKPVIVNEAFARQLFGKESSLGRLVADSNSKTADWQIVGVVGDAKYQELREEIMPTVYVPLTQGGAAFKLRTVRDPRGLISLVRAAVSSVNGNLSPSNITTQTDQIDRQLYQERLFAWLSSLFGLLALTLACVGLYGLLSMK